MLKWHVVLDAILSNPTLRVLPMVVLTTSAQENDVNEANSQHPAV